MKDSISERNQNDSLTQLLHNTQSRFGELFRQICQVVGLTQGKLSRDAKDEKRRLIEQEEIYENDLIGSMEQPAISKIMAGSQGPTYIQLYIWIRVIRTHYKSPRFAQICDEIGIDIPKLPDDWEEVLWHLSGFISPEERCGVYKQTKDEKYIEIDDFITDHKEIRWENEKKGFVARSNHTRIKSPQKDSTITERAKNPSKYHILRYLNAER